MPYPLNIDSLPFVSCLCPTYSRPDLLEEAIACFLNQDYAGRCELIILNDFPKQTLSYTGNNSVKIINNKERFSSLGEKRNATAALAQGEIYVVWDDDDLSMPGRISQAVFHIRNNCQFFRPDTCALLVSGAGMTIEKKIINWPQCAFTRSVYEKVRGYPHVSNGEDVEFSYRLQEAGVDTEFSSIAASSVEFIYRMHSNRPHASMKRYEDIPDFVEHRNPQTGLIQLKPRLYRNYKEQLHRAIKDGYREILGFAEGAKEISE